MKSKLLVMKTDTKTYRIKPLEWKGFIQPTHESYMANVPMGTYYVERTREGWSEESDWRGWQFKYCFDEYYDEGYQDCDSLEHGKQLAEADWHKRILPALDEIKEARARGDY